MVKRQAYAHILAAEQAAGLEMHPWTNDAKPEYVELVPIATGNCMQATARQANHAKPESKLLTGASNQ